MSETDYTSIKPTNVAKTEKAKEEQVVDNVKKKPITSATPKKKTLSSRIAGLLIGENGGKNIKEHITREIIIPSIKDTLASSAKTLIDMIFYRDGYYSQRGYYYGQQQRGHRTNYAASYGSSYKRRDETINYAPSEGIIDVGVYVIPDRNEAINVLNTLKEDIARFGQVAVSDYYDYINVDWDYTKQTYGWVDLHTAKVIPTRGGYTISFPPADVL